VFVNIQKNVIPEVIASMSDLDGRYEKCERNIMQFRIELDASRSEMTRFCRAITCAD
jgi:hypothetical protein